MQISHSESHVTISQGKTAVRTAEILAIEEIDNLRYLFLNSRLDFRENEKLPEGWSIRGSFTTILVQDISSEKSA